MNGDSKSSAQGQELANMQREQRPVSAVTRWPAAGVTRMLTDGKGREAEERAAPDCLQTHNLLSPLLLCSGPTNLLPVAGRVHTSVP